MAGSNEITRKLWEIVQNENATTKEKTNALSQLMQSYNSHLQTITAGPESYMNIKKNLSGYPRIMLSPLYIINNCPLCPI